MDIERAAERRLRRQQAVDAAGIMAQDELRQPEHNAQ